MESRASASWLANQPIQFKLALAFAGVLLAFVGACVGIVSALGSQQAARQAMQRTTAGVIAAQQLRSVMHEYEIAIYAVLSDDAEAAARLEPLRRRLDAATGELVSRAAGNEELHARALLVQQRQRDWIATAADPLLAQAAAVAAAERERSLHALTQRFGELDRRHGEPVLDLLQEIEQQALADLARRTAELDRATSFTEITVLAMLGLGVLAGVLALWLSGRLIVQPVRELTGLMTRLSEQDHAIVVPQQQRRDEIGAMARALEVFKQTAARTYLQNWNKTAINEVAAALQRCADAREFADTFCAELTPRLQAGLGLFFHFDEDNGQLELSGSYGFKQRRHLETRYAPGEGITGQCARERKTIVLSPVPEDYVRVHSGSGEATPRSVIALPLNLKERLLGVVEFASFGPFSSQQQELLDELLPIVALSFDNLSRALRTRELLSRSQAQAQELQRSEEALRVQREELRSTNDELSAKTVQLEEQQQRLQASEEELRVQAEELQASNEELRQKTETLNEQKQVLEILQRETENKAQELARASQYKSDFLANMSHELRTPLNSMLILSRGLADNDDGRLAPDQVESARVIFDAGSNLLRLINDILDLSKIEAGKMDVLVEPLSLQSFAQGLMRTYRPLAREKDLGFSIEVDETLPAEIHTDGSKLEQIVGNLAGNAIKFTREGQVGIRFTPCPAGLAAPLQLAPQDLFCIVVEDSGIGIPPHKLAAIFGVFEQVDASTARRYGGSGLGLSIARRLAQLLGGEVTAESTEGRGSRFSVVLPRLALSRSAGSEAPAPAVAAPAAAVPAAYAPLPYPASAPAAPPQTPRNLPAAWVDDDRGNIRPGDTVILTIEDDPLFARILVEQIRAKGFRALAAPDGESGLVLAGEYRPNGVLLDVLLPGMDGWAVMRRLRTSPATQGIPVHFISGVDESARGRELGAVGFLTKPAPREALAEAFDRLLANDQGRLRHVLVVDDDVDSFLIVQNMLASASVQVDSAHTGAEGLDALRERHFDCLVLDLQLPDMSGFDFLDQYAKLDGTPPVVIHSARDLSSDESLRLRQFTDSIVIKGARSPQRLLDEVRLFLHSMRQPGGDSYVARDVDTGLSGRSVLVVDDDMRNIFALSKTLRAKGLNVLMAQDGLKALRQLDENPAIQLVLMDIMMPGMDGYETIREIRKRPALKKLPVIAITAKAMRGDRDRCLEAGANDYLSKPLDIDKLLSMMRVWLHA
ncbi:response regulator [Tahibacter harae]|uniref:histidine kinase n=1 Tax=Tahibacter harae TaxID=2963937 RepID=A0ABT1QNN5_9GAMM|nr:response regulator [Tahibacter harae]MCQ4163638.1 response regulator [Tahibacter harae]